MTSSANDPHGYSEALSARGRALLERAPVPEYLREHFARVGSPGYVPLCIAENRLMWDLLAPRMAACRAVPERVLGYDAMIGAAGFRRQLAALLGRRVCGRAVEPGQVAALAGAGSVLEALFYALGDPGDGVLVPTPSYAGFWLDLEVRDALRIVPVPTASADGFRLTPERLERAAESAGRPVRALLLTSPDNPLGRVHPAAELERLLDWAAGAGLHVVCDEVYALSVFGAEPFVSVARLRPRLGERLHLVWAFSKDFAASGLRCGVLVTENEALLAAVDLLAEWACCSGDTQFLLGEMIADEAWVDGYVAAMRARLGAAYGAVAAALAAEGIPFLPSSAGFFLLVDLRRFLAAPTHEAERELWWRLLESTGVNLTPGAACRIVEPGFFRLCFAGAPTAEVVAGVRRVAARLR